MLVFAVWKGLVIMEIEVSGPNPAVVTHVWLPLILMGVVHAEQLQHKSLCLLTRYYLMLPHYNFLMYCLQSMESMFPCSNRSRTSTLIFLKMKDNLVSYLIYPYGLF